MRDSHKGGPAIPLPPVHDGDPGRAAKSAGRCSGWRSRPAPSASRAPLPCAIARAGLVRLASRGAPQPGPQPLGEIVLGEPAFGEGKVSRVQIEVVSLERCAVLQQARPDRLRRFVQRSVEGCKSQGPGSGYRKQRFGSREMHAVVAAQAESFGNMPHPAQHPLVRPDRTDRFPVPHDFDLAQPPGGIGRRTQRRSLRSNFTCFRGHSSTKWCIRFRQHRAVIYAALGMCRSYPSERRLSIASSSRSICLSCSDGLPFTDSAFNESFLAVVVSASHSTNFPESWWLTLIGRWVCSTVRSKSACLLAPNSARPEWYRDKVRCSRHEASLSALTRREPRIVDEGSRAAFLRAGPVAGQIPRRRPGGTEAVCPSSMRGRSSARLSSLGRFMSRCGTKLETSPGWPPAGWFRRPRTFVNERPYGKTLAENDPRSLPLAVIGMRAERGFA